MPTLAWMTRLASLLLLVCFVLPLSKCTAKQEAPVIPSPSEQTARKQEPVSLSPPAYQYLYGYQMALDDNAKLDLSPSNWWTLGGLVIVFFVPAMALLLKPHWRAPVLLVGAVPAFYFLYYWVIVFGDAQLGGILAIECWAFLGSVSAVSLLLRWRQRR